MIYFVIINENDFSLEIKLVNTIKKSISLRTIKNSISLIVNKSFAFSNVIKTLISSNSFTTFDRQILVKTTITLTNFFFNLLILFIN